MAAATGLFAEHGPGAVSLRDVAKAANVNLGLIHRYVGGKQDLVTLVLADRPGMPPLEDDALRTPAEVVDLTLDVMAADVAYYRVLVRAILDGFDVPAGVIGRATAAMRQVMPDQDADVRVAMLVATVLGWQVVAPLVLEVVGQPDLTQQELSDALRPALLAFLTADAPPA